jgi:putative endonuclease
MPPCHLACSETGSSPACPRLREGGPDRKSSDHLSFLLFNTRKIMKQFFVYIIYSKSYRIYYKGFTENPEQRIKEHNENMSRFTSGKGPWELVYLHSFPTKKEALIAEKKLKEPDPIICKGSFWNTSTKIPECRPFISLAARWVRVPPVPGSGKGSRTAKAQII